MDGMSEYSGGCQCGAVRFHIRGELKEISLCHCRMCQKAFGAYYAPMVTVKDVEFEWTRGAPAHFRSSNLIRRGFCANCGTPLTYEAEQGMALAAGTFDHPELLPPTMQYGTPSKLPFVDGLHLLPEYRGEPDSSEQDFLSRVESFQHPDHDTGDWHPHVGG
ncbi:MAG: GFA family protein [Xanthomonadaceae bacterium]|jgi:hypothetical protein|nr:GFA family protein [Xanthomonadaceae bacterium]